MNKAMDNRQKLHQISEYETLEKVAFSLEMECRKESLRKIINELASEITLETKLHDIADFLAKMNGKTIDDNDGQPGYKLVSKGKESVA